MTKVTYYFNSNGSNRDHIVTQASYEPTPVKPNMEEGISLNTINTQRILYTSYRQVIKEYGPQSKVNGQTLEMRPIKYMDLGA